MADNFYPLPVSPPADPEKAEQARREFLERQAERRKQIAAEKRRRREAEKHGVKLRPPTPLY